jgi:hypothetical protein
LVELEQIRGRFPGKSASALLIASLMTLKASYKNQPIILVVFTGHHRGGTPAMVRRCSSRKGRNGLLIVPALVPITTASCIMGWREIIT